MSQILKKLRNYQVMVQAGKFKQKNVAVLMYKMAFLISAYTIAIVNNNSNTNARSPMDYIPLHPNAEELLKILSFLLKIQKCLCAIYLVFTANKKAEPIKHSQVFL